MNCPRCAPRAESSPYRGEARPAHGVALAPEDHAAGVTIARCASCRGAFATNEALVAVDNHGRRARKPPAPGAFRRGFDPPTDPMTCPSCSGETTRREWGIGTLVFVDVCVECRGVWLDSGELEIIAGG